MRRHEAGQLPRAELNEAIIQQQPTIRQQQALIEQAQTPVAQLQDLTKRLTQPPTVESRTRPSRPGG